MNDLKKTIKQFENQVKCATKAGIFDYMFIAFGTLLGYCREGGIIGHDHDMDVGFLSELMTKEQEDAYISYCKEEGLFEYRREEGINPANGRHFWLSLRSQPKEYCMKCCHWWFFEHKGYYWHHKGGQSLIKGIPKEHLDRLKPTIFLGIETKVPVFSGHCLDFWYPPDWGTPRDGGNSSKEILMNVKRWDDKSTWSIKRII
jgi:hypothetical protein